MACPGGCFSGGGQIKVENMKSKEIAASFNLLTAKSILN
jgi:iron only hydrogenase large subunit-like protein